MNRSGRRGARFGLALLGAGLCWSGAVAAQAAAQPGSAGGESAGDALSRNLRTLAANPRSLAALMGAGRASLEVGDAQAALTFFARAEQIDPKDGRIKMWMGSALAQLEQPRPAIRFFDEAIAMGVAQAEVAGERGLAYDMIGETRRAQRDYELALRHGANPEVTRRLALSYGISGERERALQLLEEQLLIRNPAAARTRALVLALTGDSAGASRAAQAAMPGPQAEAMVPFLARLPSLSPADRALAVHFGHFPGAGQPAAPATYGVYAARDPLTSAGTPDAGQPALGGRRSQPETAARRRPDAEAAAGPSLRSSAKLAARTDVARRTPPGTGQNEAAQRVATLAVRDRQAGPAPKQEPVPGPPEPSASRPGNFASEVVVPISSPAPAGPGPAAGAESDRLAEVAAALAALSDDKPATAPTPSSRTAPTRAAAPAGRPVRAAAVAAKKTTPPAAREPGRVWVQVASGADRSALPREYARLKAKAPKLLGSRPAWTVPVNVTNRLLVGPFATNQAAQNFINELSRNGVAGFAWSSPAGQKVERLPAG